MASEKDFKDLLNCIPNPDDPRDFPPPRIGDPPPPPPPGYNPWPFDSSTEPPTPSGPSDRNSPPPLPPHEIKKRIKDLKDKCKETTYSSSIKIKKKTKFCICPTCLGLNSILDKIAGKNYFTIPFTRIKIPRFDVIAGLFGKGIGFDSNRRDGEVCGACGGTKKLPDVTDDSERYQAAAQMVKQNSEKIMEAEAKLGLGGARTTVVQGNDTILVGLGFNENQSYEVVPNGGIAPTLKGGKIPQQNATRVNAVVGKQASIAWPHQVGNYTIKCANKMSVLAGAGGINLSTNGPLVFNSGIVKITGPQISIGCVTGPLTLEGDSITVTGKTIALTPTGGEVFVKGNISNTANTTCAGHTHSESISWARATCAGTTKSTYSAPANPDNFQVGPAIWSYVSVAGAGIDVAGFYSAITMDMKSAAFRLMSPAETMNVANRMKNIATFARPWEIEYTGFIIPGTPLMTQGTFPCNFGGITGGVHIGVAASFIPFNNFPHTHTIPEMQHKHDIRLPDIDYTADNAQTVRDQVLTGAHESGVPQDPVRNTMARAMEIAMTTIEQVAGMAVWAQAKVQRFLKV